jgi:hypothetical protein
LKLSTTTLAGLVFSSASIALLAYWERRGAPPDVPDDLPGGWAEGIDGAWSRAHAPPRADAIGAIGYAPGYERALSEGGVARHDAARAQAGLNLVTSGHGPEAILMDMAGKELHRWRYDYRDIPGAPPLDGPTQNTFRRAHPFPDGSLLAIYGGRGLVKLSRASELVWFYPERAHHDLALTPEGEILTLIREERQIPRVGREPLIDDYVVRLTPEGRETQRVSVLDCLLDSRFASYVRDAPVRRGDMLHTNSLELLDGAHAGVHPAFAAGNVLVCARELDLVAVLDLRRRTALWALRNDWRAPHDPTLTDDGHLLIFDNLGNRGHSRVLELDPRAGAELWAWRAEPAERFSSLFCGTAARLSGGNTLITESCKGRAFEVTREGDVVWEYVNPHRAGARDELIAALFEVLRLPPDYLE